MNIIMNMHANVNACQDMILYEKVSNLAQYQTVKSIWEGMDNEYLVDNMRYFTKILHELKRKMDFCW